MIVICELVFDRWQHEEVNAGLVRTIIKCGFNVGLAATKEHMASIKSVLGGSVHFEEYAISIPSNIISENVSAADEYAQKIMEISDYFNLEESDWIIVAAARVAGIKGAYDAIVNKNVRCKMAFVIHSFDECLEEMYKGKGAYNLISLLNDISHVEQFKYITYNPNTSVHLNGILCDEVIEDIIFVHHPVIGSELEEKGDNNKNKIVAYGACCGKEFRRVLAEMCKRNLPHKNLLKGMYSVSINDLDTDYLFPKDTDIVIAAGGFERSELIDFLIEGDWILIPYTEDVYKTKMSGILCDAIRWGKPVIGTHCEIIDYYNSIFEIGVISNDLLSIVDDIMAINSGELNDNYSMYKSNLRRLKQYIEVENEKIIGGVFIKDKMHDY